MADSLKRISKAKDPQFQDRCRYYATEKAKEVLAESSPDAASLVYAKAVINGTAAMYDLALMVISETAIGNSVDAGNNPSEGDVEWAIMDSDASPSGVWTGMAAAYAAMNQ